MGCFLSKGWSHDIYGVTLMNDHVTRYHCELDPVPNFFWGNPPNARLNEELVI